MQTLECVKKELKFMNKVLLRMESELSEKIKNNLVVYINQTINLFPGENENLEFLKSDPNPDITK